MSSTPSVLARTVRGAGWVIAWRLGMRVLGVISTLILVRLLVPADFGVLALASSFAQTVDGMMILGTEEAVIRQAAPDRSVYDTAWTMNVIRGLTVTVIVLASAVPVAGFFGDQRLVLVLAVISLPPLFDGLSNIGTVDFRREMQFQKEFAIMVLPKFFGIVATLTAAFIHPSYTALLFGIITSQGLRSVMSYVMHPFRPRLSLRAWRGLIGYSVWTWLLSLAILLRNRSDTLVLGRLTNSTSVGVFSVGAEVAFLPTSELVEPLCRASFAGFAAANREGVSAKETFLRLLGLAVLVTLPAGVGLALVAGPLVSLAFGPAWDAAIPVLRVLGLAGVMTVFGQISLHMMSAHSLLGRLTVVTLAGAVVRIVLLLALIPRFGVAGAACAAAIAIFAEQSVTTIMALRRLRIGARVFLMHIVRPAFATGCMVGGVLLAAMWQRNAAWSLAAEVATGAISYTVALLLAWLAGGRPDGPETDTLRTIYRAITRT